MMFVFLLMNVFGGDFALTNTDTNYSSGIYNGDFEYGTGMVNGTNTTLNYFDYNNSYGHRVNSFFICFIVVCF